MRVFFGVSINERKVYARLFLCALGLILLASYLYSAFLAEPATPREIETVEYSLGNSGTTTIASATNVYTTDVGQGTQTGWSTVAPTTASQGFTIKLEGSNIQVKSAWIEFRAVSSSTASSLSDVSMGISTCPGSVSSCASAPTYRDIQLFGTPNTIFYFVQSGENNIAYMKADASGAFDGLTDSEWASGVETILRVNAVGPTLTNHTAKLYITYESDYNPSAHYAIKTVRFPLQATTTGDRGSKTASLAAGTAQAFQYNADIPDLPSNADIMDVHFELLGQSSAAARGTLTARIGTGSTSPTYITQPQVAGDTLDLFSIYRPPVDSTNFQPNVAQKIFITPATNAIQVAGGELVVTYRYSTGASVQTETVRFMVGQSVTSGSTASSTYIINPVISNTGLSVKNIYVRAHGANTAATTLHLRTDIDDTGGVAARTNTYTLSFTGTEQIGTNRIIHDLSGDAASFVSGGPLRVESRWAGASGNPVSLELFVTFTWSGSSGGAQTKTVEYFEPNSRLGGTAANNVDLQRTHVLELSFPEAYPKTLRSAYVENALVSSDVTSPVNLNMAFNADTITSGGTGFQGHVNTGEAMSFITLKGATTTVDVSRPSQKLNYSLITDMTNAHSIKSVVTYDVDYAGTETTQNDRIIETVEYSIGNSGTTSVASATNVYTTDVGQGTQTGWSTVAPTTASQGFTIKLEGSNIHVKTAWIEFRAVSSSSVSLSDVSMGLSTCPGSVSSCASAPVYRDIQLFGTPNTIFYYINSAEENIVYLKADASGAFDGLSDGQWASGVETIFRMSAIGPALTNHTAKLYITYESDYDPSAHYAIKTVRFPLQATTTGDRGSKSASLAAGTAQAFLYNAQIPDLPSNADITDVHFELLGQSSAATAATFSARIDTGSTSPAYIAQPRTVSNTIDLFSIYRPPVDSTNFQPNVTQKIFITPATNAIQVAGGELVVTYRYSTGAPVQTETVRFMVGQSVTSGSTASSTYVINPVISNTGLSVKNIYVRAHGANTAATTLHLRTDIDDTGAVPARTNTYTLSFTGTEQIGTNRIIRDLSEDAASFVSGGPLRVESRWTGATGNPVSLELFVTFTWSGSSGGAQTKTVEYFIPNSKFAGTAATNVDLQRTHVLDLAFPEAYPKTLRSAYVENMIISSDVTSPVNLNMAFNADTITAGGTGFQGHVNTGEAMSFITLYGATTTVDVSRPSQKLNFSIITDMASAHSQKSIVTYDAELHAAADIFVNAIGNQTTSWVVPTTSQMIGGAFAITSNSTTSTFTVTSLTLTATGTQGVTTTVENMTVRYDLDTSAPYNCTSESYSTGDTPFGTTANNLDANGKAVFSDSVQASSTQAICLYVELDIGSGGQNNHTLSVIIEDPSSEVSAGSATVLPASPVDINGNTLLTRGVIVQSNFHWRRGVLAETASSSATNGLQNINLSSFSKNTNYRIRFAVANSGLATSTAQTFRLEWGQKYTTCDAVSSWTRIDGVSDAWQMATTTTLTDGANTTNIGTTTGGVGDPNPNFITTNGGIKDDNDTTASVSLPPNKFLELEYSIKANNFSVEDATYCFRVTNAGQAIDTYERYPEATLKRNSDFKIQRGVSNMTAATLTITAGTDYEAPAATTSAFIRITNTQLTGAGPITTGSYNSDSITAYISNSTNIRSSITFSRAGTTVNTRVSWEIIEYIGAPGGDNEIIVRRAEPLTYVAANLAATSSAITGVSDWKDVAVFITGQHLGSVSLLNYGQVLSVATTNPSGNTVTISRGSGGVAANVSYAAVEFKGQNWKIQRVVHPYTAKGSTQIESIPEAVNSLSKTFTHVQKKVAGINNNHADFGHEVWLSGIGQVSFLIDGAVATTTNHTSVAWIIENTQNSGSVMEVTPSSGLLPTSVSANQSNIIPIGLTLTDVTIASLFVNNRSDEALSTWPEPMLTVNLYSDSQYELWRGNASANLNYRTEVVEWPTAIRKLTQNYYRFYVDNQALTPTDPWPVGGVNLGENTEVTGTNTPMIPGQTARIRMTLKVSGASMSPGFDSFKLQYATRTTTCTAIPELEWSYIGDIDDGVALWRGTTTPVLPGTPLDTLRITVSDVAGSFENSSTSTSTPYQAQLGDDIEFDWLVENRDAAEKSSYCFRMVESDGTPLFDYAQYPIMRTAGYGAASQNWRWYGNPVFETPTTTLAATNTAPVDIEYNTSVQLRVALQEINGAPGQNIKFKLQFSEYADFSTSTDVAEIGDCVASSTWCYANGGGVDDARIQTKTLGDIDACIAGVGDGCGTHNESGTTTSTFVHATNAKSEFAFTIMNAGARPNRVYYFRAFDIENNEAVPYGGGYSYPSLVSEGAKLVFTMTGVASSTVIEGVTVDFETTPSTLHFGTLPLNTSIEGAHRLTMDTNGTLGYQLFMTLSGDLENYNGATIKGITGTNASPVAWDTGCDVGATSCFGYHTSDDTLYNNPTRFSAVDTYARFSTTTLEEISYSSRPTANETTDIVFRVLIRKDQDAGLYETTIRYISVPMF